MLYWFSGSYVPCLNVSLEVLLRVISFGDRELKAGHSDARFVEKHQLCKHLDFTGICGLWLD